MRNALALPAVLILSASAYGQAADLDDDIPLDYIGRLSGVCGKSSFISSLDDEKRPVAHWNIEVFENGGVRHKNPSYKAADIRKQRVQEVAANWRIKFDFDGMSGVAIETVDGSKFQWWAKPWMQAGYPGFTVWDGKVGTSEFQQLRYRRWSETMVFSDIVPAINIFGGVLGTHKFSDHKAAQYEILDCITLDEFKEINGS